jgi:hypothetical protein
VRELEEDVAELDELVPELDVGLWSNFAHLAGGSERPTPASSPISVRADRGRPPDFVGVGTSDAGCRWWHALLLEHDSIAAPSKRSLDFFATFCTRAMTEEDVAAYHAHFDGPQGLVVGEWTADYMYESWTPMLLHRAAPEAKLLVMLMNPVERYAATLARTRSRRRKETDSLSNAVSRGRYTSQLRGLLEYFDRDRILVLQLERCLADPLGEYARTLSFLGVADDFAPASLSGGARRRARRVIGRDDGRPPGAPEPAGVELWPDLEVPLLKELEADVRELRALVPDLDLSLWPPFAHLASAHV